MERDQELELILARLIVHFPTANDFQSWLLKEVWPAYGQIVARLAASRREQAAADAHIRREAKAAASREKWETRNRATVEKIAAKRRAREEGVDERMRRTHFQDENGLWRRFR